MKIPVKNLFLLLFVLFHGVPCSQAIPAASFAERPEVQTFIADMASRHGFDADSLTRLFARVSPRPEVARTMTGQVTRPPSWTQYRANFVNPWRISHGVSFWNDNAPVLARAREAYGVPEEVVVAIIGVETRYGTYPLPHPVLDTLATLAFDYPRRADFFRNELEHYLLLMREEGRDPFSVRGSFAGAMGIPQFMPSSYRAHAVDFDGDGRRNLWSDNADAIGSVANYLRAYGWESGKPVAMRAYLQADAPGDLIANTLKPAHSVEQLQSWGVRPSEPLESDTQAAFLAVDREDGREYWLGLNNFYVITRYNRSLFYAMAVYQLSNEIRQARMATLQ